MNPFSDINLIDEHIASRYPRTIQIDATRQMTITPMVPSDWSMLGDFLEAIPSRDRKFFRHDLSDAARVERWCSQLDYWHILPILGWCDAHIVADATLQREPGLWTAHIAKIRLLLHPDYRQQGIGTQMVHELIELADELQLHKVVHECAAEQQDLISCLQKIGFQTAARLPNFIRDRDGNFHEMVLMVYSVRN